MVGAVGQLAMGLQMLQSVKSVWSDKDVSTGEKILDTFVDLSFTLPMIVSGLSDAKAAFTALMSTEAIGSLLGGKGAAGAGKGLSKIKTLLSSILKIGPAAEVAGGGLTVLGGGAEVATGGIAALSAALLPLIGILGAVALGAYGLYKAWEALAPSGQEHALKKSSSNLQKIKNEVKSTKEELDKTNAALSKYNTNMMTATEEKEYNNLKEKKKNLKAKLNNSKIDEYNASNENYQNASNILNSQNLYLNKEGNGIGLSKNLTDYAMQESENVDSLRKVIDKGGENTSNMIERYTADVKKVVDSADRIQKASNAVIESGKGLIESGELSKDETVDTYSDMLNAARSNNGGRFAMYNVGKKFSVSRQYAETFSSAYDDKALELQQYTKKNGKGSAGYDNKKYIQQGNYADSMVGGLNNRYKVKGTKSESAAASAAMSGLAESAKEFAKGKISVEDYANSMDKNVTSAMNSLDKLGSKTSDVMNNIKASLSDATLNLMSSFQSGKISGADFLHSFSKVQDSVQR
jgi:hypothetical protein